MMSSGKLCFRKPNETLGLMNLFRAQSAPNSKRNRCAVYRHLRENGTDCAIYRHERGGGGGGGGVVGFLFHERLLMTLVIYVLIDVKFNRKR